MGKIDYPRLRYLSASDKVPLLCKLLTSHHCNCPSDKRAPRIYDRAVMCNVRAFQKRVGLPVTGEVDAATWDKLLV